MLDYTLDAVEPENSALEITYSVEIIISKNLSNRIVGDRQCVFHINLIQEAKTSSG